MKLVFPTKDYEDKAKEYIQEFFDFNSEIHGSGYLDSYLEKDEYKEWVSKVSAKTKRANVSENKVPSYTYFYVREENMKIIGMIDIRLELNDFLLTEGGHIGYSIRPTERGKGYGTMMLQKALEFCKSIGLNKVLIICDKVNNASAGVIKNCGGQLENEIYSEKYGEVLQRYWIEV